MLKRLIPLLFLALLAGGGFYLVNNQQEIRDQITVSRVEVDPEVTQLVIDSGMNKRGVFVYHAATPRLEDAESFNQSCTRQEEGSAILGCYVNDTIHVYDIEDERLAGLKEVTATHEALHAVYARTDDAERMELANLLEAEYERVVQIEPALQERMAYYERTQPGERINELHSIIGTEFVGLSQELEDHYSQYFSDRSKVVSLHQQYKHSFDTLRAQSEALKAEIDQLVAQINSMTEQYNAGITNLGRRIENFNSRAQSGDFSSQSQFDSERNSLLSESNQLEAYRQTIDYNIGIYNQKIDQYNQISVETNSMYESLDSTLEPSPQI